MSAFRDDCTPQYARLLTSPGVWIGLTKVPLPWSMPVGSPVGRISSLFRRRTTEWAASAELRAAAPVSGTVVAEGRVLPDAVEGRALEADVGPPGKGGGRGADPGTGAEVLPDATGAWSDSPGVSGSTRQRV